MKKTIGFVLTAGTTALVCGAMVFASSIHATPSDSAEYVGASKCRKRHSKVLRQWQKTPHASTFDILTMMGRDTDAECVPCHSTAYGEASGFVDVDTTPDLAGTTCEACHGPGSEHIAVPKEEKERSRAAISQPTGVCVKCHNPHERRDAEMGKAALPALKKKLAELQELIAAIEAE